MLLAILYIIGSIFEILAIICFYLAINWRKDTDKLPHRVMLFLGSICYFVGLVIYFIANAFVA